MPGTKKCFSLFVTVKIYSQLKRRPGRGVVSVGGGVVSVGGGVMGVGGEGW